MYSVTQPVDTLLKWTQLTPGNIYTRVRGMIHMGDFLIVNDNYDQFTTSGQAARYFAVRLDDGGNDAFDTYYCDDIELEDRFDLVGRLTKK